MTDEEPSREDAVNERIEAFRRRRPRLKDDFINSAHGAGGKASAALIDAVFVEAFRNKTLETMADGAVLELPSGDRVASPPTASWSSPGSSQGGPSATWPSTAR